MILVIGATGYIGRYFCTEMVNRGEEILALGRSKKVQAFFEENNVPFQYFDLNDPACYDSLPIENVEAIVDLSACLAELETPIERFFEVNTLGVYRVLDFAYRNGKYHHYRFTVDNAGEVKCDIINATHISGRR